MTEKASNPIRGAPGQGAPDTGLDVEEDGAVTEIPSGLTRYLADLGLSDALLVRVISRLQATHSEEIGRSDLKK